ncbi:hypothetical protein EJ02DRAFT_454505 [Clathrospora elynae]|uniref:Uncharacterized protein n=1 Tax=Clathrospora elynae TaxID=706981 RepID=A0A6A5SPY1_9PLEO|nr:hypothetical protein EJ02DRAFT_454505 [Clathrospora elynae]
MTFQTQMGISLSNSKTPADVSKDLAANLPNSIVHRPRPDIMNIRTTSPPHTPIQLQRPLTVPLNLSSTHRSLASTPYRPQPLQGRVR